MLVSTSTHEFIGDETKPICLRCKSLDKDCHYLTQPRQSDDTSDTSSPKYDANHPMVSDPLPCLALAPIDRTPDTARLQQFCMVQSANTFKNIGRPFETFWTSYVPKFSCLDASVASLVVAIAARQRVSHHAPTDVEKPILIRLYNKHHMNALASLSSAEAQQKPEVVLLCCLMFITMENVEDSLANSFLHLRYGLHVLRDWKAAKRANKIQTTASIDDLITHTIEPMFARFEAAVAPTIHLSQPHQIDQSVLSWSLPTPPNTFENLAQARGALYEIVQWVFSQGHHQMVTRNATQPDFYLSLELCRVWHQRLDEYRNDHPRIAEVYWSSLLALETNHKVIELLIKCTTLPNELIWSSIHARTLEEVLSNIQIIDAQGLVNLPSRSRKQNLLPRMLPALFTVATISSSRTIQDQALDLINEIHSSMHGDECFPARIIAAIRQAESLLAASSEFPLMTMDSRIRPLSAELHPGWPGKVVVTYTRPFVNPVLYDDPDLGTITAAEARHTIEVPWLSSDSPPSRIIWLWPAIEFLRLAGSAGLVGPNGNHCLCKTYGGLFSLLDDMKSPDSLK